MGDLEKNCGRISCVITIFFTFVAIIGSFVMNYMTYTGKLIGGKFCRSFNHP